MAKVSRVEAKYFFRMGYSVRIKTLNSALRNVFYVHQKNINHELVVRGRVKPVVSSFRPRRIPHSSDNNYSLIGRKSGHERGNKARQTLSRI